MRDESECTLPRYLVSGSQEKLHSIIDLISRPLDSLPGSTSLSRLPNKDVDFLYRTAFDYAHSAEYRRAFDMECIERRKLYFKSQHKGELYSSKWFGVQSLLNGEEISACRQSISEAIDRLVALSSTQDKLDLFVTPKRFKQQNQATTENLMSQADAYQVAKCFGVAKSDVRKLIDTDILTQLAGHPTTRDALFDVRSIDLHFQAEVKEKKKYHIGFRELVDSNYLKLFRATIADLICGIAEKKVQALSDRSPAPLGSMFFLRSDLNKFLERNICFMNSDINLGDVAKFYSVKLNSIVYLVEQGLLYTNHWQKPNNPADVDVKLDSFLVFYKNYICLNRFSKTIGRRIDWVTRSVVEEGFKPDIEYEDAAFYRRTKIFENFLHEFEV